MADTTTNDTNVLGDPLFFGAGMTFAIFILGLIFIELGRDESARAAVGGAGAPAVQGPAIAGE